MLGYTSYKVVFRDFGYELFTRKFEADPSKALDGTFTKMVAWYGNEWG